MTKANPSTDSVRSIHQDCDIRCQLKEHKGYDTCHRSGECQMARDTNSYSDKGERSTPLEQPGLDAASFELQRHFGREGSIYGIKACEEIARIAIVAYQRSARSESGATASRLADTLESIGERATPGPWAWDQRGEKVNEWGLGIAFDANEKQLAGRFTDEDAIYDEYVCSHEAATCNYKDPALICTLRNNLPEIISALRAASHEEERKP